MLIVSCGESLEIVGKNTYKVGGDKYLECTGNEFYKTCKEKISPRETRYAFAFENGFWVKVDKKDYESYKKGDIYKLKISKWLEY